MSSILMAAVLSGSGSLPAQWGYGCCGGYAPVYFVAADDGQGSRKGKGHRHHHGHHHGGMGPVLARLQAIEKRLDALDAKREVEKLVEQRIKEERVRNELKELREKVQNLELENKLKGVEKNIEAKQRVEKLEKRLGDIENMLKRLFERSRGGDDKKPKFFRDNEQAQDIQTSADEVAAVAEVEQPRSPAQSARIIVTSLPAGAELYVGQKRIHGSSFRTPLLENGTYSYDLRVQWFEDGQLRQHVRSVSFEPGTETFVHFEDLRSTTR